MKAKDDKARRAPRKGGGVEAARTYRRDDAHRFDSVEDAARTRGLQRDAKTGSFTTAKSTRLIKRSAAKYAAVLERLAKK